MFVLLFCYFIYPLIPQMQHGSVCLSLFSKPNFFIFFGFLVMQKYANTFYWVFFTRKCNISFKIELYSYLIKECNQTSCEVIFIKLMLAENFHNVKFFFLLILFNLKNRYLSETVTVKECQDSK